MRFPTRLRDRDGAPRWGTLAMGRFLASLWTPAGACPATAFVGTPARCRDCGTPLTLTDGGRTLTHPDTPADRFARLADPDDWPF